MEDYKQYLSENADEAERAAAAQVMEGLSGLRLEAKVQAVAAERAALYRRAFWQRILISVVALVLVAGAAFFIFGKKEATALPPQQQEQNITPPSENQAPPVEKTGDKKASEPIAQLRPEERLPTPRYPAPNVTMIRGDENENKALKSLLDQLWYTDYPLRGLTVNGAFEKVDIALKKRDFMAAYLELEQLEETRSANDTLRYLKGYCLMEMGEANVALTNFNAVQGRHAAWEAQLQWYRGLALLMVDKRSEALPIFKMIAANTKHLYHRQAEKAAKLVMRDER